MNENFTRRLQQIHNKDPQSGCAGLHKAAALGEYRRRPALQADTVEAAVTRADKLMYQAKNQKNMVVTESSGIGKDGEGISFEGSGTDQAAGAHRG